MCGIWGFVTDEAGRGSGGRLRFVQNAAVAGTLRGTDSTGAFIVPHKPERADWCKVVGTGVDWLQSKYTQEKFNHTTAGAMRAVVGHNRSATFGKVTLDNAHPFQEGAITLVHNGTLDYMGDLKVQAAGVGSKKKPVEVDSHLICHNLAQHSIDEVIPTLYGAFALVWHDSRNDSLYMIRNSQRPMHLMRAKCEDTVLFASEPDMLWWLAGRCNFVRDDIHSLDPGVLLEFKKGETKPVARRIDLGYRTKSYSYYYGSGGSSTRSSTASTEAAAPGKAQPSAPTAVPGGGSSRRGREALTLLGFTPRTELEFSVDTLVNSRGQTCVVNGWAYYTNEAGKTEAIQAVIHGIDREFASKRKEDDWSVRPVAVWNIGEAGKEQPCLVCRLVRVSPGFSKPSSTTDRKVLGPAGSLIPVADWILATTGGCVQCGRALCVPDAAEIVWVNNRTQPMCGMCADDMTAMDEIKLALN